MNKKIIKDQFIHIDTYIHIHTYTYRTCIVRRLNICTCVYSLYMTMYMCMCVCIYICLGDCLCISSADAVRQGLVSKHSFCSIPPCGTGRGWQSAPLKKLDCSDVAPACSWAAASASRSSPVCLIWPLRHPLSCSNQRA